MKNRTIIVTGGAKGIGKAICKILAEDGYNILINYNNSENEAKELKNELNKMYENIRVEIFKCDVGKRKEVNKMVEFTLKEFGDIYSVINNAGISYTKIFNDISNEEFLTVLNTNLIGTFNVIQEALNKYMINKKDGVIVNISSIWGIVGASMEVAYSASKAGIIGMSKALAKELGPSNIRVNVIAPGWIDTDMNKEYSDEDKELFKKEVPLERIGTVEDVAHLVHFLVSDKSRYITGQVFKIDGGYLT